MDAVDFLVQHLPNRDVHYLSFHSFSLPRPLSSSSSQKHETLSLTFFGTAPDIHFLDNYGRGCECRGLLYFGTNTCPSVICNPTTKKWNSLPPLKEVNHIPNHWTYHNCVGFGYDDDSKDFKSVRMYTHVYNYGIKGEYADPVAEIYAFKKNCWEVIKCNRWEELNSTLLAIYSVTGTHVNGNCYWQAHLTTTGRCMLSFNFATEKFSTFPLPISDTDIAKYDYFLDPFDLDDKLGLFIYPRPISNATNTVHVWVWVEGSWTELFRIDLHNVSRPLQLMHGLLFLEGKGSGQFSRLRVYDLATGKLEPLDVYAYNGKMKIFRYTKRTCPLLDERQWMEMTRKRKVDNEDCARKVDAEDCVSSARVKWRNLTFEC